MKTKTQKSQALGGIANAVRVLSQTAPTPAERDEMIALSKQLLQLQVEWAADEAKAPFTKMRREVKLVRFEQSTGRTETDLEADLNELLADGWEIVYSKVDLMSQPKWRVLLARKVPS